MTRARESTGIASNSQTQTSERKKKKSGRMWGCEPFGLREMVSRAKSESSMSCEKAQQSLSAI